MTTTNIIPANIAQSFLRDMSARYSFPEFNGLTMRPVEGEKEARRYGANALIASASVTPTGQMASLVSQLSVVLVAKPSEVENVFLGEICMSYDHFNDGSNGRRTNFIISADSRYGDTCHVYLGAMEHQAFNRVKSHMAHHRDKQVALKASNANG